MTSINTSDVVNAAAQVAGAVAAKCGVSADDLIAKLPSDLQSAARTYAPVVASWGADYANQWLALMFAGKTRSAYQMYLKTAQTADTFTEAERFSLELESDVAANADRIATQESIASTVCKAMLPAVLALVGL